MEKENILFKMEKFMKEFGKMANLLKNKDK
jgi:hypothetical protein